MMMRHYSTFYAGIGVGVGFLLIRLTAAQTFGDAVFAAGLTAVELSVVWLWERRTRQLGSDLGRWSQEEARKNRRRSLTQAADDDFAYRQGLIEEARLEREKLEREIERDYLLGDLKTLNTIAVNSVRAGYFAGIAANVGAVSGATSLEDRSDEYE